MTDIEQKLRKFYDTKTAQRTEEADRQAREEVAQELFKTGFQRLLNNVIRPPCEAFCEGLKNHDGHAKFQVNSYSTEAWVEVTRLDGEDLEGFGLERTLRFRCDEISRRIRVDVHPETLGRGLVLEPNQVAETVVEDALMALLAELPRVGRTK